MCLQLEGGLGATAGKALLASFFQVSVWKLEAELDGPLAWLSRACSICVLCGFSAQKNNLERCLERKHLVYTGIGLSSLSCTPYLALKWVDAHSNSQLMLTSASWCRIWHSLNVSSLDLDFSPSWKWVRRLGNAGYVLATRLQKGRQIFSALWNFLPFPLSPCLPFMDFYLHAQHVCSVPIGPLFALAHLGDSCSPQPQKAFI